MMQLYGSVKSRTIRVLWALQEMGLDYEHFPTAPRSDEIRSLNPLGKIPVLVDGDAVITDSTAILTYLADKHAQLTYPAGSVERARQDGHTFFLLDEFDACLWTASRNRYINPEERRVPEIIPALEWEFSNSQTQFVERLGDGEFLMGDKMTVPDIIAAHCGGWAVIARFPITQPAFRAYTDRLRARPAFQRALDHKA